jgi:hypothetical protein
MHIPQAYIRIQIDYNDQIFKALATSLLIIVATADIVATYSHAD